VVGGGWREKKPTTEAFIPSLGIDWFMRIVLIGGCFGERNWDLGPGEEGFGRSSSGGKKHLPIVYDTAG